LLKTFYFSLGQELGKDNILSLSQLVTDKSRVGSKFTKLQNQILNIEEINSEAKLTEHVEMLIHITELWLQNAELKDSV
jgi:hypothetical protein